MSMLQFNLANVVNGFRSGYGTIHYLERNKELQARSSGGGYAGAFIQTSYKLVKTTYKANLLICTLNKINPYRKFMGFGMVALIGLNLINFLSKDDISLPYNGTKTTLPTKGFCAVVWEFTPQFLVITNIALLAIESYINPAKALVGFAVMGIMTLTPLEINPAIPLTAAFLAIYCTCDKIKRVMISLEIGAKLFS